jgi:hypothetical protein
MSVPLSEVIAAAKRHSEALEDDTTLIESESRHFWVEALDELGIPFSSWDTSDRHETIPPRMRNQIAGQTVHGYPVIISIDGIPHIVWGSHVDLPPGSIIPDITEHSGVIGIVALEHIDRTR